MPQSPTDATRFTATGPYISSKPQSSTSFNSNPPQSTAGASRGSQLNIGGSVPDGESAQQKIARLRSAAALARRGKESQFDVAVRVGRVWADRAHRFTALSLIGLTLLSGAVATAGITDMLLHNRRRRNEWLAEQQAKSARDLADAKRAQAQGDATEDQVLLINRERASHEAAEAKKNRPGVWKRTTSWMFGGLSSEEKKGGRLGAALTESNELPQLSDSKDSGHDVVDMVKEQFAGHRGQGEEVQAVLRPPGGPLDRQAQHVIDAFSGSGKSWTSWMTGR